MGEPPETPDQRLVDGARFRVLPMHIDCPPKCAFCYERRMPDLLPWAETVTVPPWNEESFGEFQELSTMAREWEQRESKSTIYGHLPAMERKADGLKYHPTCDVFASGLNHAQIEELVKLRVGEVYTLYTVGLGIDYDFIAYLTEKYPETFRLHLSMVTLQPEIRRFNMHKKIDVDLLRRIVRITRGATFFLILFTEEQILADVNELKELTTAENGTIYVHKLYTNRVSTKRVTEYAAAAEVEMEPAIRRLAEENRGGRPIVVSPGSEHYAWTYRHEIRESLGACAGTADEVVFCAPGAFEVVDGFFRDRPTRVVAMESVFGGNTDFVQSTTLAGVIEQLAAMIAEGPPIRRVYLPASLFWIDRQYDLRGDTVEALRDAYPDLEVTVLPVPDDVIWSVITLENCVHFYNRA